MDKLTNEMIQLIVNEYREELRQILPDVQAIIEESDISLIGSIMLNPSFTKGGGGGVGQKFLFDNF